MRVMNCFASIVERISQAGNWIAGAALVGMIVVVVANVIMRLFGEALFGSYALVVIFAVLAVSFSIVYTALERGHVTIGFLMERLSRRVRAIIEAFAYVLGIGIWFSAAWVGLAYARKMWLLDEIIIPIDIPIAPFRYYWGIAMIALCLVLLADLARAVSRAIRG